MVEVILATQEAEVRGDFRESETSPSDADVFNNKKTHVEVEKWSCSVVRYPGEEAAWCPPQAWLACETEPHSPPLQSRRTQTRTAPVVLQRHTPLDRPVQEVPSVGRLEITRLLTGVLPYSSRVRY